MGGDENMCVDGQLQQPSEPCHVNCLAPNDLPAGQGGDRDVGRLKPTKEEESMCVGVQPKQHSEPCLESSSEPTGSLAEQEAAEAARKAKLDKEEKKKKRSLKKTRRMIQTVF